MKITNTDKTHTEFEYHEPERGELIKAVAYTLGRGIEIISGGITYTITVDGAGGLSVHAYGRGFESMNISPRSGNDVRIWCETWKPSEV